jgi:hypothetical protein
MLMNILLIAAKRRAVSVSRFDVCLEDPLTHKNPMIFTHVPRETCDFGASLILRQIES